MLCMIFQFSFKGEEHLCGHNLKYNLFGHIHKTWKRYDRKQFNNEYFWHN